MYNWIPEERQKMTEKKIFEETMVKKFPKLVTANKGISIHKNLNKHWYIIFKVLKNKATSYFSSIV